MSRSLSSHAGVPLSRYDIPAFVADIEQVVAATTDPHHIAAAVEHRLPRLLATPNLLAAEQREPCAEHYRSHILAVAPSGAFSVVALVWLPGQVTPIHDHICWCVVGVLEGRECETRYHLRQNAAGERWLQPAGTETMTHNHTCVLVPPDENIHCVRNAGATLAISLHVYGADLDRVATHSSINECFDNLPVRDDSNGIVVPWRCPTP